MIEVEIRSFLTEEQYQELLKFFKENSEFIKEDCQETHYFNCREDLRIQKNNFFSKIWMKKGRIHDDSREEIEIKFDRGDFEKLSNLFFSLGYDIEIKWFRKRFEFKWQEIDVMLDYTKGYGYILELEILTDEKNKQKTLELLKQKLQTLNIEETPKQEFDEKYDYYRKNWRNLIRQ